MQADMQLNKINSFERNEVFPCNNSKETISGVVAKGLNNATNKPKTTTFNNSEVAHEGHKVKQDEVQESLINCLEEKVRVSGGLSARQSHKNKRIWGVTFLPVMSACNKLRPTTFPRNVTLHVMSPLYENLFPVPPCNEAPGTSSHNVYLSSTSSTDNGCFTTWQKYVGKQITKRFLNNKQSIPGQTSKPIEDFIKTLKENNVSFTSDNFLGSGQYGTAYRFGKYVVKVPVNIHGEMVDWYSGWNRSANPERVIRYLNKANQDESFSRVANVNYRGEDTKVLVTKYIKGSRLKGEKEINKALKLLQERGFHMHDFYVDGNILKTKGGKLYFIDADQLVIDPEKRLERTPSLATKDLEDMLALRLSVKYMQAKENNDQNKINQLNYMSQFFKGITGIAVKKQG